MLICRPKYNIVLLCSAFVPVKQFFLSDSSVFDFVTEFFFSNLLLELQLQLATSLHP
jgi:hypothetical protein